MSFFFCSFFCWETGLLHFFRKRVQKAWSRRGRFIRYFYLNSLVYKPKVQGGGGGGSGGGGGGSGGEGGGPRKSVKFGDTALLGEDAKTFWETLSVSDITSGVIDCNRDVKGQSQLPLYVLVRKCYVDLEKSVEEIWKTPRNQQGHPFMATILGTPGIGKTFFAFFMMQKLAKEGVTVVYHNAVWEATYLFTKTGCSFVAGDVKVGEAEFLNHIYDPRTVYICDSAKPAGGLPCRQLLITSPNPVVWKDITKQIGLVRYMPVWTLPELTVLRDWGFKNVTDLEKRFAMWGGSVRFVLAKPEPKESLDAAVKGCDPLILDLIYLSFVEENNYTKSSHQLVHMQVDAPYTKFVNDFASTYIADKVTRRFREKILSDAHHLIVGGEGMGPLGALRGLKMEPLVHDMLAEGGTFNVHKLLDVDPTTGHATGTIVEDTLVLPACSTREFSLTRAGVMSPAGAFVAGSYLKPDSRILAAVDSVEFPNLLFQSTVSKKHELKHDGMVKILKGLGNPINPRLYFVVPRGRTYQEFIRKQPYTAPSSSKAVANIDPSVQQVEQYALELPLPQGIVDKL